MVDMVVLVVLVVLLDVVELLLEELNVVKAHCDHDHDPLGVLDVGLRGWPKPNGWNHEPVGCGKLWGTYGYPG